jgi:hypothetical protein
MPGDNSATVAIGAPVEFPQNGPTNGVITRLNASTFNLPAIGTYQVSFSVSVTEAGQLVLSLNGSELAYTVYRRATGTSEISGEALVQSTSADSALSLNNPAADSTALTITPLAGGADPAVASLVIERLSQPLAWHPPRGFRRRLMTRARSAPGKRLASTCRRYVLIATIKGPASALSSRLLA